MKTGLLLFVAALSLSAQTITINNNSIRVTGTDSNHYYSIYQSTNLLGPYSSVASFIGRPSPFVFPITETNETMFYEAAKENGFIIYSTNRTVEVGLNNCGHYVGYFSFTNQSWSVDTNFTQIVTDLVRANTCIESFGNPSGFSFGGSPLTVNPPSSSTVYQFKVFFPSGLPSAPYPLMLTGFNP